MIETGLVFLLFSAVLASAFFSGAEIGVVSYPYIKLEALRRKKRHIAERLLALKRDMDVLLTSILIGNTVALVTATSVFTYLCNTMIGIQSDVVVTAIFTPIIVLFGESLPKTIMRSRYEAILPYMLGALEWVCRALSPITKVITAFSKRLSKIAGRETAYTSPVLNRDEFLYLINEDTLQVRLYDEERLLVKRFFALLEKKVVDVMIPLDKVVKVDGDMDIEGFMSIVEEALYTRYPVFIGRQDNIIGYVNIYDIMSEARGRSVKDYIRPVIFVSEELSIFETFKMMQSLSMRAAIVYGCNRENIGMVSIHDIKQRIIKEAA